MPSPIFNQQNQQRPSLMSALNQLKQNPAQILGTKYNIPQGMTNPEEILQHLLTTGQVTQGQVNQVMQMRNDPRMQQLFN